MKIYNTLSRKTEDFVPIQGNVATLYTCGPTVYDYYHIGNLRNAVFNDTLRRTLDASGYSVKHVMNITDVGHLVSDADSGEDKLEKGAQREGKTVWQVAEHYTSAFKNDMQSMNILSPNGYHNKIHDDNYARATDFINQQIDTVSILLEKGFAYATKQAIYFDVTKLKDYGILSGQKLTDKETGARPDVVTDPDKKSSHDFALWFFAVGHYSDHTMQWDSPWGSGFPGWHLECSTIIHETLGDPIDIHTGGIDHIGTHHPNEMAQTEAAFGHQLAKYWVHNEFILVDGTKMSKSKGNSYTLKDVTDHGYDAMALRLLYLQAHYRTELNFSWDNLKAAQSRLMRWKSFADLKWQNVADDNTNDVVFEQPLLDALANDLDTPKALEIVEQTLDVFEKLNSYSTGLDKLIELIDQLLGIKLIGTDIHPDQKTILTERQKARHNKDWSESDRLRDKLQATGIGVRDTDSGQIWFRT